MPSRIRTIDFANLTAGQFSNGVDFRLISKGRMLEQITPLTVPSTAAGLFGLKFGDDGDPMRINGQGQPINLSGDDRTNGVLLVWMGSGINTPTGVIEFVVSFPEGAPAP